MAVSNTTIKRLPVYLQYLKQLPADTENISATAIANGLRLGAVQVRKDLSGVSGEGRPRVGYNVESLIASLEKALGYNEKSTAVLVGAGKSVSYTHLTTTTAAETYEPILRAE